MIYYVLEFQTTGGTGSVIPTMHQSRQEAEARYHTVLAAAATSEIEKHGAAILSEDLFVVKKELAPREGAPEPEPEV